MHHEININQIRNILFTVLVFLMASMPPCRAQDGDGAKVVEVIASSSIYSGNMPGAREQAISNAMVSAVAEATLSLLPVQFQIDNFQQLNEVLFEEIDAYVQDYKVLTEFMPGKSYRALVQVTVLQDKIRERLLASGLLVDQNRLPKILFFVSEENLGDVLPSFWWGEDLLFVVPVSEEAMSEALAGKRFDIVPHGNLSQPLNYDLALNVQDAISIGLHRAADVVVIGAAKVEKTTNVMSGNIKSFKANVTVRAFRCDTGVEIALTTRTAVSAAEDAVEGGRKALYEAGTLAGKDLAIQLASVWSEKNKGRKVVEIVVQGTSELVNFVKFRKILGKIDGVTAIHIVEMKANESTILVDYTGSARALAEELMLNTFDSFGIDIFEVLPEKLGIELISG